LIGLGARGGGDLVVTVVVMLQCGSDSGGHSNGVRGGDLMTAVVHVGGRVFGLPNVSIR
jgi:hypothetical protein